MFYFIFDFLFINFQNRDGAGISNHLSEKTRAYLPHTVNVIAADGVAMESTVVLLTLFCIILAGSSLV